MSRWLNKKFRRSKKRLQKTIKILTALSRALVEREYGENVATINALAVGLGGKPGLAAVAR